MSGDAVKLSGKDLSATLSALRSAPAPPNVAASDQRMQGRIDLEAGILVTCLPADGDAKTVRGLLRHLSPAGVALLITEPLRAGRDEIIIFLPHATPTAGNAGVYVCCHVLHCHAVATGMYRVGAGFDSLLTEQTALMVCPPEPRAMALGN